MLETAKFQTRTSIKGERSRSGVGYTYLFSWALSGASTQIRRGSTLFFLKKYLSGINRLILKINMKKSIITIFLAGLLFVCFGQESGTITTVQEYKVTRVREFYTSEIVNGSKTGYAFIPGNEYAAEGSLFIDLKKNTLSFILPFKLGYDKITEKIEDKSIATRSGEFLTANYKVIITHLYHMGKNGVYDIRLLYDFSTKLDAFSRFLNITAVSFNNDFGLKTLTADEEMEMEDIKIENEKWKNAISNEKEELVNPTPRDLKSGNFKFSQFSTEVIDSDSINLEYVLNYLYAGFMYEDDKTELVAWTCQDCIKCKFENFEQGMDVIEDFPYKTGNYTVISGYETYKSNNGEYLIISFSTSNCYPQNNYTTPGVLGIALFKKNEQKWELEFFNPFTAALGTYQNAGRINQVINLEKDLNGYCMFFTDGGHGLDLRTKTLQLFSIKNKNFIHLFKDTNYEYRLIPESYSQEIPIIQWKAHIESKNNEVIIIKEGSINQETISDLNSNEIYGLPEKSNEMIKIFDAAKRLKEFNFKIQNRYKLNNSKLVETFSETLIINN